MSNITHLGFAVDDILSDSGRNMFIRIAIYYWEHQTPATVGSIWVWLEKEYGARRYYTDTRPRREGTYHQSLVDGVYVEFDSPALQTVFLLRWA